MSQRRRSKGLGSSQVNDAEDDFIPTQTERHSQDQVNQKVSELVQFLLVKDQKKIPIKRAEMLKSVIREYRDAYSEILNRAGRTLQQVFGLKLVEIDTKRHTFILINNLPCAQGEHLCRDKEKQKMGLLLIILSFIFMKGNSVKDSALWEFLHQLRVYPGKQHSVFGDVRKLVTEEFVRQKYLETTPIPLTDPPESKFQWGPRAEKETSKKDVLNFVAKIQGKDPTFWASQCSEAEATP
ncbi:non-structural maintenance of chromosomes element 3 homolog [Poecile atricapillus]|uniref:non-structural maintenance of chromosomes element 3 homolog n=1 Tax=Poecile atricapillus TaxID=48891 RepID=UPI002739698D|nr:non-structural maintenance of chromosomes element 3 homolog [Poecile atricapillus]